jgi:uncharacterized membrane protein YdjX (TVP38/TMEM64 family)
MIHSKVLVVDDTLLRIGSANLNNRSMGVDTECDLIIEAGTQAERERITQIRNRLIGDHCGTSAAAVAAAVEETGSIVRAAETLRGNGHRLCPINDGEPDRNEFASYIEGIADPERPIDPDALVREMIGKDAPRRPISALAKIGLGGLLILLLTLAWQFTPLSEWAQPDAVRDALAGFAGWSAAPVVVVLVFLVAGLLAFPVTILIAATAAAFGPALGLAYAAAGTLLSAMLTYAVGAKLGRESLTTVLGPRLTRVRNRIARQGVIAVAAIRLVPVAPFTIVNLVAGASAIPLTDYMLGTLIGMAPGLVVMSVLGYQIIEIILNPSPVAVASLVAAVAAWITVSLGVQWLVSRYWSEKT